MRRQGKAKLARKTSRNFGREAREGAGIYPRHLLSSLLLPRTMTPTPRECAVESFPIHQSAVQRSLLSTPQLILLGKQYTDVGRSLAPWLNQTLQVEAIQQSGTLQCRHWCGNSWERVTLPGCGLGRHAVSTMGSPEGCAQVAPCPSAPSPLRPRCNIHLAAHPTSDGASHLSHMAAAWHGTLAHREPQSSAVGWRSVWPFLRKQPSPFRFDFDFPSASTCELIGYLGSQLSGKDVVHQDRSLESQAALANGTKLIPFLSLDFPPGLLELGPQKAKGLVPSIRIMQRVPGPSTALARGMLPRPESSSHLCLAARCPLSGTARGNPAGAAMKLWLPIAGAL